MLWVLMHSGEGLTQMKIYIFLTIQHFQRKPAMKHCIGENYHLILSISWFSHDITIEWLMIFLFSMHYMHVAENQKFSDDNFWLENFA